MLDLLYSFILCTIIALLISPIVFKVFKKLKTGQNILEYVDNHASKQGTLSMGGVIFVISSLFTIIFFKSSKILAFLLLCITFCYALVGFLDDFLKIKLKHNEGLKPYQKIIGQVGIAVIVSVFVYRFSLLGSGMLIPFTSVLVDIGWWIIPFVILFFIAVTNSVNLTDGLDGLAGYVSLIIIFTLGTISLIKCNA
ncbi:MAG: phospho-N-acetylmuramoyl-pentapeptide-transferase, partial [Clostridia bacterium]|nr:phospho-N-acetylmuramoyl-pentapeptide-transferase [Clostridia bacterium]